MQTKILTNSRTLFLLSDREPFLHQLNELPEIITLLRVIVGVKWIDWTFIHCAMLARGRLAATHEELNRKAIDEDRPMGLHLVC